MKKLLIVLAFVMSCIAILLARGVGQWKVGSPSHDPASDAMFETHLSPTGTLSVVRQPPAADFNRGRLESLPAYNPKSRHPWQVDLRSFDASSLDLSDRLADLLHASFDSRTRWPAQLPAGFDRERIMELGKDPGLRVRELHARGMTGKGVGIGIIDQTLLADHPEYRDRLRLYEEIHNCRGGDSSPGQGQAQMHGPAVASIAVGKSVGVAPEADLYYIAETHGVGRAEGQFEWDFQWLAQSVNRLLDVNKTLPREKRIRVMSISVGWTPVQAGYGEITAAVQRAKREGVFVISTSLELTHGLTFHGLGREAMADPNAFASRGPGSWWAEGTWDERLRAGKRLLVPMDSRCTASPTGLEDYVFYGQGGWSWCVPWIAGLYALACQVQPDITPEQFWAVALETGETRNVYHDEQDVRFGPIANPVALIERLQRDHAR